MEVRRYYSAINDIQISCAYLQRDVFIKLWSGVFYGHIYVHFVSGVFVYFSSLFVPTYGRLYLLNDVQ